MAEHSPMPRSIRPGAVSPVRRSIHRNRESVSRPLMAISTLSVALAPMHGLRATPGAAYASVFALGGLALFGTRSLARTRGVAAASIARSPLLWPTGLLFSGAALAGIWNAEHASAALTLLLFAVVLAWANLLAVWSGTSLIVGAKLRWAYAYGAFISAIVSLFQHSSARIRPTGLSGAPNELGIVAALGILFLFVGQPDLRRSFRLATRSFLRVPMCIILGLTVLRSGSRSAALILALGIAISLWTHRRMFRLRHFVVGLAVVCAATLLWPAAKETSLLQRVEGGATIQQADRERADVNHEAFKEVQASWPVGAGPGTGLRPHSVLIRAPLEAGLLGLMGYVALVGVAFVSASSIAIALSVALVYATTLWEPWLWFALALGFRIGGRRARIRLFPKTVP